MPQRYSIAVYGYEPIRAEWTLEEARKELTEMLDEEEAKCRRKFKKAYRHRPTPDCGSITLGKDKDSALWLGATVITI